MSKPYQDLVTWARVVLDLAYPRNCPVCQTALDEADRGVICRICLGQVKFIEPPFCEQCALPYAGQVTGETFRCGYCHGRFFNFSRAVAAVRAEGVGRAAIHLLKYHGAQYVVPHLAEWLVMAGRRWVDWSAADVIVPVPLYPRKERARGFNQARLLAEALGAAVGKPVLSRAVRRVKDTATQTKLGREERARNLRGAFAVRQVAAVTGQRVVLVDDVFTTGVTLDSCARVLRNAGAADVVALTVARGT